MLARQASCVGALTKDAPQYALDPPIECVVFGWGANEDGQLGFDDGEEFVAQPRVVEALLGSRIRGREPGRTSLVCGSRMSLAVAADGPVWSWGWNDRGTLGHCDKGRKRKPKKVSALRGVKVVQAAVGGWHTLVLDQAGKVYAWGGNEYVQCGVDADTRDIMTPVPCVPQLRVKQVACGGMHSLALTYDGDVYTWGERWGEFSLKIERKPKKVEGAQGIAQIACGAFHNLALTREGRVITWGTNDYGQLGNGGTTYRTSPDKVVDLDDVQISDISAGGWHSLALCREGGVYVWGRGEYGRLGLGDVTGSSRLRPQKVLALEGHRIVQGSAGGTHTAVLTDTGRVFIWGRGSFGRMGNGSLKTKHSPTEVILPGGHSRWRVISISAGGRHTCCLALPIHCDPHPSGGSEGDDEVSEFEKISDMHFASTENEEAAGKTGVFGGWFGGSSPPDEENRPVNGNPAVGFVDEDSRKVGDHEGDVPEAVLNSTVNNESTVTNDEGVSGADDKSMVDSDVKVNGKDPVGDVETPKSEVSLKRGIQGRVESLVGEFEAGASGLRESNVEKSAENA
ncbi:hypothetical protein BSKO_13680 [Bryopsis sp. KO-2023]|nr:hypothetical protein BSKO_13680 [Bryopsis sp. KO-2023]